MQSGSVEEAKWIAEQRSTLETYLDRHGLENISLPEDPGWFVAPYVALWAIPSKKNPGAIGWWGISGDLPTDYISSTEGRTARAALQAFSKQWFEISSYLLRDKDHPTIKVGNAANRKQLGDLLKRRAAILLDWATDDSLW
jgi:hypothetical protein